MTEHPVEGDEHRRLRELLGSYALGDLPPELLGGLRAHLDGCASCRLELAEIAPLATDLRTVDPSRLVGLSSPAPDLGARIREAVAQERQLRDARAAKDARRAARARGRRRLLAAAAAVVVLTTGIGVGAGLDRELGTPAPQALPTAAPSSPAPVVPVEPLSLAPAGASSPVVQTAGLIAHTWGVEVRLVGTGFTEGRAYRAAFRTRDGRLLPAGEFLGTGEKKITCNLQAALLRPDTVGFVVMDDVGAPVLTAALA